VLLIAMLLAIAKSVILCTLSVVLSCGMYFVTFDAEHCSVPSFVLEFLLTLCAMVQRLKI